MAEPSSATLGNEEKSVSRVNSFTKFLRSPSRPKAKSMKKSSSNTFSRILFGRKRSSNEGEGSNAGVDDSRLDNNEENAPSLIEEVKEVVGTTIDDVIHPVNKETSVHQKTNAAVSNKSRDVSSTESKENQHTLLAKFKEEVLDVSDQTKEIKHHLLDKFKDELGETKEGLKEDYDKAKKELKTILHKDHKSPDKNPSYDISAEKKPSMEEVKAPNLAQRLQEEVVAVVSTPENDSKKGQEEIKEKGEEKKEDGCVSSLAQGLEKLCAPWSSKKEE